MKNSSTLQAISIPEPKHLPDGNQRQYILQHVESYEQSKQPFGLLMIELLKTRDKAALSALLKGKFLEVIEYIDFEILLQNENNTGLELYMNFDSTDEAVLNGTEKVRGGKEQSNSVLFQWPVLSSSVIHFPLHQRYLDNELLLYLKKRNATNCDHCVILNLNNTYDIFGLIIFYFGKSSISGELAGSTDKIAFHFANTLSHINANEKRISFEKEKILLGTVSEEIGRAKDSDELLNAFSVRLKSLLKFKNSVIGIINWADNSYSPFLTDPEDINGNNPELKELKEGVYSIKDPVMEDILGSGQAIVHKLDEIIDKPGIPGCVRALYECGRRQMISIQLKRNETVIGFASVIYDEAGTFTAKAIEVLKFLAPILSTALANILLTEQIDRENHQKAVLSGLRRDLTSIRGKEELFEVINTQLKKLIHFTHNNMGIVSEDGKTYKGLLLDPGSTARRSDIYSDLVASANDVTDCICDQVFKSAQPVIIPMSKFIDKNPPLWFKVNYETGTQEIAITTLRGEDGAKYLFLLFSDKKNNFNKESLEILEQISGHLATAISSVRSNEDQTEREKEKSTLLSLSQDMAALRNKQDLLEIIQTKLTNFFDFSRFYISILKPERQLHLFFLMTSGGKVSMPEGWDKISKKEFQIEGDEVLERIMLSDSPIRYSLKRLSRYPVASEYIRSYMDDTVDQLIGVRLKAGDKIIGCAWLQTTTNISIPLLQGICAQLSTALFNILANEQIIAQLEEIKAFKNRLQEENSYLIEHIHTGNCSKEIIGNSSCMHDVYNHVNQVAKSTSTVLLMGETGTGKEVIANAIHMNSSRSGKLMVKVNCAAMPANLIESELFGHERGSFTGATERRIGKFELANEGTIFLDEIGEMPLELQAKLLRAIQEREIERVGGRQTIKVNVRIIAATNRDLEKEVEAGQFRSDLFYRLNVYPINLPPLRERQEDIMHLANAFLERYSKRNNKNITSISQKVQQELLNYPWPGNIRELEHLIERSVLMGTGSALTEIFLPKKDFHKKNSNNGFSFKTIEDNERDHIIQTLRRCDGKLSGNGGGAEFLGVPVSTLSSKLVKFGITKEQIFKK